MENQAIKTKPIGTGIAVLLAFTSILLFFSHFYISAAIALVIACFSNAYDFKKITSFYQVINGILLSFFLGYLLEQPLNGHFPFLSIAIPTAVLSLSIRTAFYSKFTYSGFLWAEPLLSGIAVALFVYGNVERNSGWMQWAIPLPIMLFNVMISLNIARDGNKYKSVARKTSLIEVGKTALDFELPDQDSNLVRLSDFKGKRHLLLLFVKGDWCPACHMKLRTYQREKERFQEKNTLILAIGPDPVGVNREMVEKLGLDYMILSDPTNKIANQYGLPVFNMPSKTEGGADDYPLPASFLVDKDGIIRYTSRPEKVGEFLNPALIFPILATLS